MFFLKCCQVTREALNSNVLRQSWAAVKDLRRKNVPNTHDSLLCCSYMTYSCGLQSCLNATCSADERRWNQHMFDSIRQQIHVSNFETTDLRVCLGAIFKRKANKQKLCFFCKSYAAIFSIFFVSLEPHVERPEESVKIANKTSQPGVFLIRIRLLRSKKRKHFILRFLTEY